MGSELESTIQYFIDNKVPCFINRNAGPCLQYESNSVFRVSSYVMLTGSAIVECICVLNNETESHQVYCAKMPHPFPQKADDTMKDEDMGSTKDNNICSKLAHFKTHGITCDVDEHGILYHTATCPYLVKAWSRSSKLPLLVFLQHKDNSETIIEVGVSSVSIPAKTGAPKSQAVRSSDADAVAFHLISPHALERIAARYALGSSKYGDYNWTKGFSWGQIINHSLRHIFHYLAGDRREDHLAGAAWGLLTLMHYEETRTGTDDLLRYSTTFNGIAPNGTDTAATPQ